MDIGDIIDMENRLGDRFQEAAKQYVGFHIRKLTKDPAEAALTIWLQAAQLYRSLLGQSPADDFAYVLLLSSARELRRIFDQSPKVARGRAMDAAMIRGRLVVRMTCQHPDTLEDSEFLVIEPWQIPAEPLTLPVPPEHPREAKEEQPK